LLRALPFAVVAAVVASLIQLPVTNDAAWQIWVGRQLLGGERLYRDIIEINPPLWFWFGAVVSPFGWNGLLIVLGLAAVVSIILASRLYRFWWLPYALVFAFFLTGISATGQREQFTLISVTPYVLLAAARAEGRKVQLPLALAIGFWAALGFALKHYFALVPLALQAWLWLRGRSITPEFIAVCVLGAAYIAAIFVFTPEYLTGIVPLVREAYAHYDQKLSWFLLNEVVLIGAVAVLGIWIAVPRGPLVQALAISATVFLGIYVGQLKGFRYQGVPALGLFALAAFASMARLDPSSLRNKAAGAILVLVPIYALIGSMIIPPRSPTAQYLCTLRPGTKVLVLAVNGGHAWPAVESCDLRWSSRQMILWTLQSPSLRNFTRNEILRDLATRPGIVVIVKKPERTSPYRFVMSDSRIVTALKPYRVIDENENFEALELRTTSPSGPK
jgi:hypothetical protein